MSFSLCCLHLYSEIKIRGEKEMGKVIPVLRNGTDEIAMILNR